MAEPAKRAAGGGRGSPAPANPVDHRENKVCARAAASGFRSRHADNAAGARPIGSGPAQAGTNGKADPWLPERAAPPTLPPALLPR